MRAAPNLLRKELTAAWVDPCPKEVNGTACRHAISAEFARATKLGSGPLDAVLVVPEGAALRAGRPGVLLPGGSFVVKLLQGAGCGEYQRALRAHFRRVAWVQPRATRSESREMYLVGVGRLLVPRGLDAV